MAITDGKDGVSKSGEGGNGTRKVMTVAEAGRKGGLAVRDERGHTFYEEIGKKGGQKVRELINRGKTRS